MPEREDRPLFSKPEWLDEEDYQKYHALARDPFSLIVQRWDDISGALRAMEMESAKREKLEESRALVDNSKSLEDPPSLPRKSTVFLRRLFRRSKAR